MTREIEFRAWDYDNNKMIFWTLNDLLVRFGNPEYQFNVEDRPSFLFDWMQYTGLKDKNGKKIFEGDVIYICGLGNYQVEDIRADYDTLLNARIENDMGEIVGNIYENPKLSGGKNEEEND